MNYFTASREFIRGGVGALVLLIVPFLVYSQFNYPIESRVTVIAPYPAFLSDYGTPGKVSATLTLKDPNRNGIPVKVRVNVKSPDKNVSIVTKPGSELLLPSGLNAGVPYALSVVELADLFSINKLDVTPSTVLGQGGRLPEGLYFFNLEVLEGVSGREILVSNVQLGAQLVWLTLNEPPFLNFPANGRTITPTLPQNVMFQWTPRHIQSLNAGFDTKYTFRLVEVATGHNPFQAILSTSSPRFEASGLAYPYYNFTQVDFQLTEGKQYAWQVQAYSETGKEMFKNEGLSEVFTFFYTSACPKPVLPSVVPGNPSELRWSAGLGATAGNGVESYTVQYRPAGSTSAWQMNTYTPTGIGDISFSHPLSFLEAGKTFDVQIKAVCRINESDPVYAGSARNEKLISCEEGPKQLSISDDQTQPGQKIVSWLTVEGASGYKIKAEQTGGGWLTLNTLPPNQASYSLSGIPVKIRVDAVCDGDDKEGLPLLVTSTTSGFQGTCAVPDPLGFKAGDLNVDNKLPIEWRTSSIFQRYIFRYRLKGSLSEADWKTIDTTMVPVYPEGADGAIYEYTIKFVCGPDKESSTQPAYYQVQRPQTIVTDPTTGSCFPPAHTAHEMTGNTSCDIICDKVPGAQKYELAYAVAGTENWQIEQSNRPRFSLNTLTNGTKYVYKIRAVCTDGNSIYSDTSSFRAVKPADISGSCQKITDFDTLSTTTGEIVLKWDAKPAYTSYAVFYHDESQGVASWHTLSLDTATVPYDTAVVTGLKPGRLYEIQIQPYCGTDKASKSDVKSFRTRRGQPITTDEDFSCGSSANIIPPGPCDHHPTVNSIIHAADFDVRIDNVRSPGNGEGVMLLPYMNNALVGVVLKDVMVDANEKMCKGKIWVKTVKLNAIGFDNAAKIQGYMNDVNSLMNDLDANILIIEEYIGKVEEAYGKLVDAKQEVKEKFNQLKQAIKDYKENKSNDTATKKSLKDRITNSLNNLKEDLKNVDWSKVVKDVITTVTNVVDKLEELVKKGLEELQALRRDSAKEESVKNESDRVSRQQAMGAINTTTEGFIVGSNDVSSMDSLNQDVQTVTLSNSDIQYLKDNNANFKTFYEKSEAINRRNKIINKTFAYALVALDVLSDVQQFKAVVGYVRDDLKKDVTNLLTSSIEDALAGKNPELEKKVKDLIEKKLEPMVQPYIFW